MLNPQSKLLPLHEGAYGIKAHRVPDLFLLGFSVCMF